MTAYSLEVLREGRTVKRMAKPRGKALFHANLKRHRT